MSLPHLPGFNFERNIGRSLFHKSQKFFYTDNSIHTNIYNDKERPKVLTSAHPSITNLGPTSPPWVVFDKQVLCFDGIFRELKEGKNENEGTRRCKIFYFLEDGTMKITEPKEQNSGLEQGVLVRRHQISKPPPNDNDIYSVDDLDIGNTLLVYGVCYTLLDCDGFTKTFLRKIGLVLGEPMLSLEKSSEQPAKVEHFGKKESKFWKYDGQVLKFLCFYEDDDNKERRKMVLKYYLADDTIEIIEVHSPNSGRDGHVFLSRCKLPKSNEYLQQPGSSSTKLLLNVYQSRNKVNVCMVDSAQVNELPACYHDNELMLGMFINVLGRKFLICDCDGFTKEYYETKFGITNFPSIKIETETEELTKPLAPPYNGFGSYEDSLNSAVRLLPHPPKKDLIKFLTNDRQGLDGKVLRYSARLVGGDDNDRDRKFILSFHLVDETIKIYEVVDENSGTSGGRFLERCKILLPGQDRNTCNIPEYYNARDLTIGETLEINKRSFLLIGADEYTMAYMESHTHDFPQSDMKLLHEKLCSILTRDSIGRFNLNKSLSKKEFHQILGDLTNHKLTQQEIISVYRFLKKRKESSQPINSSLHKEVKGQLKKHGFQDFNYIKDLCYHFDTNKSQCLSIFRIRLILKSMKFPIDSKLLDQFLKAISVDETIDYVNMIELMYWQTSAGDLITCSQVAVDGDDDDDGGDGRGKIDASILRNFLIEFLGEF